MNFNKLFDDFRDEMIRRRGYLTEDNVRYYLFACMLRQDRNLNHYLLELPYSNIGSVKGLKSPNVPANSPKLQLDMCYSDGVEVVAIEIKFHRHPISSTTAFPHTMSAGGIFNDCRRLDIISAASPDVKLRKLLVYVTDDEMHAYFEKNGSTYRNKITAVYTLGLGNNYSVGLNLDRNVTGHEPIAFIDAALKSLSAANPAAVNLNLQMAYSVDFASKSPSLSDKDGNGNNCHIRIFEIL